MGYELKDNEKITTKPELAHEWAEAVGKNQDGYGHGVVDATVLVCAGLDAGEAPDVACKRCDSMGITGFMAGCMARWVSYFHPRGDEFRRWWNKDTQIGTEGDKANESGGVLNPAILNIG